jgi:hypothetical protein
MSVGDRHPVCKVCDSYHCKCQAELTKKESEHQSYTLTPKQLSTNPLDTQVGGNHYKDFKIQPVEFTIANNLDFIQGNVIKYITRHKTKNGIEDLKKVIHYAQLAAKLQYGEDI